MRDEFDQSDPYGTDDYEEIQTMWADAISRED